MTNELNRVEAELSRCRKIIQHMIDQTTPLEPVPGDPMWSRRIQLDQVIAERDAALTELEAYKSQLRALIHISDATGWERHTCGEISKARNLLEKNQ